jgi:raffinose/stachyose/melibiose transport system permease protein
VTQSLPGRRQRRWHIAVLLAPALAIFTGLMIVPLVGSLRLALYTGTPEQGEAFNGINNYVRLFTDPYLAQAFWNALLNNVHFFIIHMLVQNPVGILLAALISIPTLRGRAVYRTAIFLPAMLSYVIVGFIWKLILSPTWGISRSLLQTVGLGGLFAPWLGQTHTALTTVALISCWQSVGIPMMLIYAALLAIPDELFEAAACDGVTGVSQFFKIRLPLIWPTIGIVSVLTFAGNFNAFDLVYVVQGTLAGPDSSTDILGTFLYRTFFGYELQLGDPYLGATIANVMVLIILGGVCLYLFGVQRRLVRHQM